MSRSISHVRALGYGLSGFVVWSVSDTFTKLVGQTRLPPAQILVVASLFCVLIIAGFMGARGKLHRLKPQRWKVELVRAVIYTLSSFANVVSFTHFPLTTVYIAVFMSPLLVAVLASLLLRESLSLGQGLAILAGFGGVVFALLPGHEDFGNVAVMAGLALVLFPLLISGNTLLVRVQGRTENSESMAFFPILMRMVFILPFFAPSFQAMTGEQIIYLAGHGFGLAIGSLLMMNALKHAPAAIVWPFQYSQLVTGAILGYLIWHQMPSWHLVGGAAVIAAAGLYLARHARKIDLRARATV